MPALVWSIGNAHYNSLLKAKQTELELMGFVLISAFELRESVITMPFAVLDERLNIPESGYQGYIKLNDTLIWQSASVTDAINPEILPRTRTNEASFFTFENAQTTYFLYAFTAEFQNYNRFEAVHFYIANHSRDLDAEHMVFTRTLWQSALVITAIIGMVLVLGLLSVIMPLRTLIHQLRRTRAGKQQRLAGEYPTELNAVKHTINTVLEEEQQQRQRYQNALQDLAHSLKTPLTVIKGDPELPPGLLSQVDQIDAIITRQLSRTRLSQHAGHQQLALAPSVDKVCQSMGKIYRDKDLQLSTKSSDISYPIDQADWYEILGNIVDNACKAATSKVTVNLYVEGPWVVLACADDGPGIPEAQQQLILERGVRLDSYTEGTGIGLATVNDLVDLYGGKIRFDRAPFTVLIYLPK
jgi:two-component system sensor histidine kinase PhoQ